MSRRGGGVYLDTCVLVSLFHGDSGYPAAEAWLASTQSQDLWISHWVLLEFASATALRMRRGDLNAAKVEPLQQALEAFRRERLGMLEPRGEDFLVARAWVQSSEAVGLRAGDALHLAVAQRRGLTVVSADQVLAAAARGLGLDILELAPA